MIDDKVQKIGKKGSTGYRRHRLREIGNNASESRSASSCKNDRLHHDCCLPLASDARAKSAGPPSLCAGGHKITVRDLSMLRRPQSANHFELSGRIDQKIIKPPPPAPDTLPQNAPLDMARSYNSSIR